MSAPAWLLDAIHATESVPVPIVPKTANQPWVQDECQATLIDIELTSDVPSVPNVPKDLQLHMDELAAATNRGERNPSNSLDEILKCGETAWLWQVHLPNRTLRVATSPASTTAEMKEMYPAAIWLEAIE